VEVLLAGDLGPMILKIVSPEKMAKNRRFGQLEKFYRNLRTKTFLYIKATHILAGFNSRPITLQVGTTPPDKIYLTMAT
jgi:hypothetical protein